LLHERFRHRRIVLLTGRQPEGEWSPFPIDAGMDFRRQPASAPS
jgi:hypothetical protein